VSRLERWRARLGYAWATGRRAGVGPLVRMIVRGLLEPLVSWRTYDFYLSDLGPPIAPYSGAVPLDIRVATDADFARFESTLLREGVTRAEIEIRRTTGGRCFIGVAGDRLIHFTWVLRHQVWLPELGATLRLGPDEVYAVFAYTDPAWRGRGVQPEVSNFMLRREQAEGVRHHYYFVMRHNLPARRITTRHDVGTAARVVRTARTVRLAFVPGFLARGLRSGAPPRLDPGPALDLGLVGLWIRSRSR
jgi:GNAT superfamily N-acetyltransferase